MGSLTSSEISQAAKFITKAAGINFHPDVVTNSGPEYENLTLILAKMAAMGSMEISADLLKLLPLADAMSAALHVFEASAMPSDPSRQTSWLAAVCSMGSPYAAILGSLHAHPNHLKGSEKISPKEIVRLLTPARFIRQAIIKIQSFIDQTNPEAYSPDPLEQYSALADFVMFLSNITRQLTLFLAKVPAVLLANPGYHQRVAPLLHDCLNPELLREVLTCNSAFTNSFLTSQIPYVEWENEFAEPINFRGQFINSLSMVAGNILMIAPEAEEELAIMETVLGNGAWVGPYLGCVLGVLRDEEEVVRTPVAMLTDLRAIFILLTESQVNTGFETLKEVVQGSDMQYQIAEVADAVENLFTLVPGEGTSADQTYLIWTRVMIHTVRISSACRAAYDKAPAPEGSSWWRQIAEGLSGVADGVTHLAELRKDAIELTELLQYTQTLNFVFSSCLAALISQFNGADKDAAYDSLTPVDLLAFFSAIEELTIMATTIPWFRPLYERDVNFVMPLYAALCIAKQLVRCCFIRGAPVSNPGWTPEDLHDLYEAGTRTFEITTRASFALMGLPHEDRQLLQRGAGTVVPQTWQEQRPHDFSEPTVLVGIPPLVLLATLRLQGGNMRKLDGTSKECTAAFKTLPQNRQRELLADLLCLIRLKGVGTHIENDMTETLRVFLPGVEGYLSPCLIPEDKGGLQGMHLIMSIMGTEDAATYMSSPTKPPPPGKESKEKEKEKTTAPELPALERLINSATDKNARDRHGAVRATVLATRRCARLACTNLHNALQGPDGRRNKVCSACRMVHYCCVSCQKADWKEHKAGCKMFQAVMEEEANADDIGLVTPRTVRGR